MGACSERDRISAAGLQASPNGYWSGMRQSMGSRPASTRAALARENGRLPKKPLAADSGDGCADSMTTWRVVSISASLPASRRAPEDEDDALLLVVDRAQHLVGEDLPALALVRRRPGLADRQRRVEQQHTLARPVVEASVAGRRDAQVGLELLEDVLQRRRRWYPPAHREAQAVRLPGAVVRVLAQDHGLDLGVRGQVQRGEDLVGWGVDRASPPLGGDELLELAPVGLGELPPQDGVPISLHPPIVPAQIARLRAITAGMAGRLATVSDDILTRLREVCLALPEVTERLSHGSPTWFVRGKKTVATYVDNHHGDGRLAIWCPAPPGVQGALVTEEPDRFFVPAYVGHRGWLGVRLDRELDWDEVAGIVEDAYRLVAPKKLVTELDREPG